MISHNLLDLGATPSDCPAMQRAQASPVIISESGDLARLERIALASGTYDEAWLQKLVQSNPSILPINEIEPAFGTAIPIAIEVPCGHGYIDNLFITPAGEIIVVEVKLWRNAQARREVVAQSLDYVAALTGLGYDAFEGAVVRGEGDVTRVYDCIKDHPDALDEAEFVDAVTNNLARGRVLVIALGDGIRSETEALTELLQSHAGAHFTFALVEIATWSNTATGDILAIPSTLAKTVMIERGIVRVEEGRAVIAPVPTRTSTQKQTLSSAGFYDLMAARDPKLPAAIQAFLNRVEPLGVYPDQMASLNFKVEVPGIPKPVNLGYIQKNGQFWSSPASWALPEEIWRPYFEALAKAIDGEVAAGKENYVSLDGKSAPRIEQLLPVHQEVWAKAIEQVVDALRVQARADEG